MASNNDFQILLQAVLDSKSIGESDISKVQKVVDKYHVNLTADLDTAQTLATIKKIVPELEKELSKVTGIDIQINDADILKAIKQVSVETAKAAKEQEALTNAMARGREQAELLRQSEEKRQQMAQNNAINKNLEQEYALRQKIQSSLNGGDTSVYATKVAQLQSQFEKLGLSEQEVAAKMQGVKTAYTSLQASSGDKLVANNEKFQASLTSAANEAKILKTQLDQIYNPSRQGKLSNDIQNWLTKNTAATKKAKLELEKYYNELSSGRVSVARLNEIKTAFDGIDTQMRSMGKLGDSLFTGMTNQAQKFLQWVSVAQIVMQGIHATKEAVSNVKELDDALVDLRKTTSMTSEQLKDFYYDSNDTAKQMGVTTEEIITQASAWSRLGYSSADAATKMAKLSSQFASISPDMNTDEATNGLVSIMKAFDINEDNVLDGIMSKINEIGNTAATSNGEIVNMLSKSSSAMKEANNTLEQTIALETAA